MTWTASAKPAAAPTPPAPAAPPEHHHEHIVYTEDPTRFAGYAGRLGQIARMAAIGGAQKVASVRHLAYTSDLGEAFRPVVPVWAVNATCTLSFFLTKYLLQT